jgi:glycosyltransferase involved in cell wall biosynthesis
MTNKRLKILFILPNLDNGGAERVMANLVNNINTTRFEPILVVIDGRNRFYDIADTVRLIDLNIQKVSQSFFKLRRILLAEKPDLVFSNLSHLNQFLALTSPFFPKTKFVFRESSTLSKLHTQDGMVALRRWIVRRFYPKMAGLICESQLMADDLIHNFSIPPTCITIIHNPFDTEGVQKFAKTDPVAPRTARYRFISLGRLSPEKGIDRALRALALLPDLDFEYLLIGDGSSKNELQALAAELGIEKRVKFLGAMKNPFGYLASADLKILTSHYEGFPNVLGEAGACGVPIITFKDLGGIKEIIVEGMNGFTVENGNIHDLAAAILRGVETDFDHAKIRQHVADNFGLKKIIGQHEVLFEQVVSA